MINLSESDLALDDANYRVADLSSDEDDERQHKAWCPTYLPRHAVADTHDQIRENRDAGGCVEEVGGVGQVCVVWAFSAV